MQSSSYPETMKWLFILPLFLTSVLTAPTLPKLNLPLPNFEVRQHATLGGALNDVVQDTLKAGYSGAAVLQFLGGTTVNAGVEAYKAGQNYVKESIDSIDLEAAVNATEEVVKEEKIAMIERVFEFKRQALRSLEAIKNQYAAAMNGFITGSLNNVNAALATAGATIVMSKDAAVTLSESLTMDNLDQAMQEAQDSMNEALNDINGAIEDSAEAVQEAGNQFLESVVSIKEELSEAAENFNSQQAFHNGTVNLGVVINATVNGVQQSAQDFGVFHALDNMVHAVVAGVPEKINSVLPEEVRAVLKAKPEVVETEVETDDSETLLRTLDYEENAVDFDGETEQIEIEPKILPNMPEMEPTDDTDDDEIHIIVHDKAPKKLETTINGQEMVPELMEEPEKVEVYVDGILARTDTEDILGEDYFSAAVPRGFE